MPVIAATGSGVAAGRGYEAFESGIVFQFKNGRVIDGREHFDVLYARGDCWS